MNHLLDSRERTLKRAVKRLRKAAVDLEKVRDKPGDPILPVGFPEPEDDDTWDIAAEVVAHGGGEVSHDALAELIHYIADMFEP